MKTKLQTAKEKYLRGDTLGALAIVSKFKRLGDDKDVIKLAIDCVNNGSFYTQIGKNINECINDGIKSMVVRYGW